MREMNGSKVVAGWTTVIGVYGRAASWSSRRTCRECLHCHAGALQVRIPLADDGGVWLEDGGAEHHPQARDTYSALAQVELN